MISQTAQGLASLGRNGDSMLVHMSPEEVGGLKQVGDSLGIKMSTNPYTGMPEAFSFGDFFTSFLPTIAGIAAAPATGGFSMAPILAGAGTGALLAAAKGDDPLMGGITGGFGGYGGGNLAGSFGKMAAQGTTADSMGKLADAAVAQSTQGAANMGNIGMANTFNTGAPSVMGQAGTYAQGLNPQIYTGSKGMFDVGGTQNQILGGIGRSVESEAPSLIGDNFKNVGSGIKNLTGFGDMSIGDAYDKFTSPAVGGSASQLAMPIGGAVLAGLEPSDLGYGTGNLYEDPEKGKYRGPQGQLNLSDKYSSGLRLATGGTIQSGGIRDLYGTPDNQPTISPGLSGFGLGRLNNLAGEQAMTQAQTLGYAEGGETSLNLDRLPSLNVNTGTQGYGGSNMPEGLEKFRTALSMAGEMNTINPGARVFSRMMSGLLSGDPEMIGMIQGKGAPSSLIRGFDDPAYANNPQWAVPAGYVPTTPTYSINPSGTNTSAQHSALSKMAKGGYLDGAGDGMSDSIPATIEGKQPARLADGEFVIPADVVSHLGNGSSKAGSKRLYAMLDKVRHARTGNKKQGKEINPAKYMPA